MMVFVAVVSVLLIFLLVSMKSQDKVSQCVGEAIASKSISALVMEGQKLEESAQPSFFLQSIEQLWNRWHRDLAAELVRDFVLMFPEEKLGQYWLQQILEIEPEIAEKLLYQEFLEVYYKPTIAAGCGAVG